MRATDSWRELARPVVRFLRIEASGGVLLLVATVAALGWANSPWSTSYEDLWGTTLSIRFGDFEITENLRHWVNDGLMALFFFVVGLEIKRELVVGQLASASDAALPAIAALGGMVVPAALYLAINGGGVGGAGWGIPMATDIAFAVGVLVLLGVRVPGSLKVLLLGHRCDLGRVGGIGQCQQEIAVRPSGWVHGDVEGHAAPSRHLLEPAELPGGGDDAPGEEADVGEGGAGRDAGLGAHQSLREQVVLGQPTVEGVRGHRPVPHAREERMEASRLPSRGVAGQQRIRGHGLSRRTAVSKNRSSSSIAR
ncbi:MAG TPA: Na+/H+ antiporter NhaA [Acidimicrobiales bacterium]|nr:Na+/H+ antiporter NhaA [Acidimicrobiales bacterium]